MVSLRCDVKDSFESGGYAFYDSNLFCYMTFTRIQAWDMTSRVYLVFRVHNISESVVEIMGNFNFFGHYIGNNKNGYDKCYKWI